jgi:hypothetical protein
MASKAAINKNKATTKILSKYWWVLSKKFSGGVKCYRYKDMYNGVGKLDIRAFWGEILITE